MSEKKDVSFEIYSDSEKMLEQIVDKSVSYTHLTLPTIVDV